MQLPRRRRYCSKHTSGRSRTTSNQEPRGITASGLFRTRRQPQRGRRRGNNEAPKRRKERQQFLAHVKTEQERRQRKKHQERVGEEKGIPREREGAYGPRIQPYPHPKTRHLLTWAPNLRRISTSSCARVFPVCAGAPCVLMRTRSVLPVSICSQTICAPWV